MTKQNIVVPLGKGFQSPEEAKNYFAQRGVEVSVLGMERGCAILEIPAETYALPQAGQQGQPSPGCCQQPQAGAQPPPGQPQGAPQPAAGGPQPPQAGQPTPAPAGPPSAPTFSPEEMETGNVAPVDEAQLMDDLVNGRVSAQAVTDALANRQSRLHALREAIKKKEEDDDGETP